MGFTNKLCEIKYVHKINQSKFFYNILKITTRKMYNYIKAKNKHNKIIKQPRKLSRWREVRVHYYANLNIFSGSK